MKPKTLWTIVAILAGMALFGVVSSVILVKKQAEMSAAMTKLQKDLEDSQSALKKAQEEIQEGNILRSQLKEQLQDFKGKLATAQKKIDQYREYALLIRDKINNAAEVNEALATRNREINSRLVRVELENQELRQKFEDPDFLKQALRELRFKKAPASAPAAPRARASKKPVVKKPSPSSRPAPRRILALPQDQKRIIPVVPEQEPGNGGFIVRDGHSTFEGIVDIRVLPADIPETKPQL